MTNDRTKRTLTFEVSDAPMLVHALSIAACTARMCGHPDAEKRLREYLAVIKQFEPDEAKHFAEEAWGEMGMALAQAPSFHVKIDKGRWENEFNHWSGGYLYVQIGDRQWCGNRGFDRFKPGAPEVETLCKALQEIAPMDCVGTFDNRLQDRPW
jgi:hypothetical protein